MNYIPVKKLPKDNTLAIIIRHAERHAIDDMTNALQILLTEDGHRDSFNLGTELSEFNPGNIFHSPVPRCRETAEAINEGLVEAGVESIVSGHLFDLGGPYLKGDWHEVVKLTTELGPLPFVRKWFSNELPKGLMLSLEQSAKVGLQVLIDQLRSGKGTTINISHDWNIMVLREYYFDLSHEEIGVPDFLDGMAAFIEGNSLHLFYHDDERMIDLSQE